MTHTAFPAVTDFRSGERLAAADVAPCWRLDPRRAMTLRPRVSSRLSIVKGRAWVTLGASLQGAGNESGDHVLEAGQSLVVPAGARVVLEPWHPPADTSWLKFDWCIEPRVEVPGPALRFRREVVAPARDLGVALHQTGGALVRLVRGLLGYGEYLVAGRGKVLTPFESNPP